MYSSHIKTLLRLKNKIDASVKGVYAAVKFSENTCKKLANYCKANNIPNTIDKSEFHTTVIYSKAPIYWNALGKIKDKVIVKSTDISGFDLFGKEKDSLVIKYKSDFLQDRFNIAMKKGASYDFPEYIPHITLSYDCKDIDISKLPTPDFDIEIVEEYSEPLDIDWKDNVKVVTASTESDEFHRELKKALSNNKILNIKPPPLMWHENDKGERRVYDFTQKDPYKDLEGMDYKEFKYAHSRFPSVRHEVYDGNKQILVFNESCSSELPILLVNKEGMSLTNALLTASVACERCLNIMLNALGSDHGYAKDSLEAHKCNTHCELCEQIDPDWDKYYKNKFKSKFEEIAFFNNANYVKQAEALYNLLINRFEFFYEKRQQYLDPKTNALVGILIPTPGLPWKYRQLNHIVFHINKDQAEEAEMHLIENNGKKYAHLYIYDDVVNKLKQSNMLDYPNSVKDYRSLLVIYKEALIHEFTHLFDFRDDKLDLETHDHKSLKAYYNHIDERRAYFLQAAGELISYMRFATKDERDRILNLNSQQFIDTFKKFNHNDFIKNLDAANYEEWLKKTLKLQKDLLSNNNPNLLNKLLKMIRGDKYEILSKYSDYTINDLTHYIIKDELLNKKNKVQKAELASYFNLDINKDFSKQLNHINFASINNVIIDTNLMLHTLNYIKHKDIDSKRYIANNLKYIKR